MFLLVSGRHVGAHPDGHQYGGSIQISINLGKKFLRIICIRKIAVTWNLVRVFAYSPSFFSLNLDFIYWMILIFILNSVTLKTSNTEFSGDEVWELFNRTSPYNCDVSRNWIFLAFTKLKVNRDKSWTLYDFLGHSFYHCHYLMFLRGSSWK